MIETEQVILIDVGIDRVWEYVRDIGNWASVFPGCRECEVIDAQNSRWVIKVGAGGLVRTVNVQVRVDEWGGPERVRFSYKLDGDPVEGNGAYTAIRKGPQQTEMSLHVCVAGQGAAAPMWEAMSRPLLPQLAKSFAEQLKIEIEKSAGASASHVASESASHGVFGVIRRWLGNFLRRLSASKS